MNAILDLLESIALQRGTQGNKLNASKTHPISRALVSFSSLKASLIPLAQPI